MPKEIERRFVVFGMDRRTTFTEYPQSHIDQGYYPTNENDKILRIRIKNGAKVEIITKSGSGQIREEEPAPTIAGGEYDLLTAHFLLENAPYRIRKQRYLRDGWEIDRFEHPFQGLVIAERETEEATTSDELPSWITKAIEVTNDLNNLDLAKIAHDCVGRPNEPMMAVWRRVFKNGPLPPDLRALIE